jgi:hypothetical protein
MTSEFADTISLASILRDISVNRSDEVRSQRGREDGGKLEGLSRGLGRILNIVNRNNGSSERHKGELRGIDSE